MTEKIRSYLLSLAIAAGTAVAGLISESVGLPWLMAIVAGLLAAPGPTRRILTTFEFSSTLLLILTAAVAVGTLDYDLKFFTSLWFMSLMGLTAISSLLCLIFRYKAGKGVPYILVHSSVIVILIGGGMNFHGKQSGMLHLEEGQTSNEAQLFRDGKPTQEKISLPFSVRLDRFKVEFYDTSLELYVFRQGEDVPAATLAAEPGVEATVDGTHIRFLATREHPFVPTEGHPPIKMVLGEIEVDGQKGFVMEGRPVNAANNLGLVLHKKQGDVKSYQSTLTVLDDKGEEVRTQSVVVNDPLVYGGWWLYQSNWDPNNLKYSGIQVVNDPGLYIALAGLVLLVIGALGKIRFRKAAAPEEVTE